MSSDELHKLEDAIKNNVIKGASGVTRAALTALKIKAHSLRMENVENFVMNIEEYGDYLCKLRPSMACVRNAIMIAIGNLKRYVKADTSLEDAVKFLSQECDRLIDTSKKALESIANNLHELVNEGDTILTHSYSTTVINALTKIHERKRFSVVSTESRPSFEGLETARLLADKGVSVTVIIDAAIGMFMKNIDKVVIGADAILTDYSIVNKVGSFPIALTAREYDIPVIVVAESLKKHEGTEIELEEREPSELLPKDLANKGVNARNPFFEVVPSKYLSYIVTEGGIIKL